jgi:HK97 family phage major capsid protein
MTPNEATYTVVGGLAKVSKQLFTDVDDVASFMPRELTNWIIIGENYQLLQGNGTTPNQTGLFNTSGVTREYSSTDGMGERAA